MANDKLSADDVDKIATAPADWDNVSALVEQLSSKGKTPSLSDRPELLSIARSLVRALESPRETIIRLCWAETTLYAAINTAIRLNLFSLMSQDGDSQKTINQLSEMAGADPLLLGRILNHLSTMGIVDKTGPREYKNNNLSRTLTIPKYTDGFPCIADGVLASLNKLPQYLASTQYQNPTNAIDGPFQFGYGTSQHWFAWAHENQPVLSQFHNHMGAYHQGRPSWMDVDFYPVAERLAKDARTDADAVFLVDVGGSKGHDLEEFHRKHPDVPGQLILQDLPAVIGEVSQLPEKIVPTSYDFFTEQPVKGARAYYLHSVLHDWPDDACQKILAQLTPAMKPGYSKLLINENVILDTGADWQVTGQDMMMMAMVSSRERNEEDWRQLLKLAGLRIIKIWSHPDGVESLIECELSSS